MRTFVYNKLVTQVCELNICGCGTPNECYEWLIEYLTDLDNKNWDKYNYEYDSWKLIQIINGFLDQKGFVEHGTTCRCSWLTNKGRELLETLKYMKKYDFDFNPDVDTEYGKWFWIEEDDENENK